MKGKIKNMEWNFQPETGSLTVRGRGAMEDWGEWKERPWEDFREAIHSVMIDSGITGIGNGAFRDCTALEEVELADTVERLGVFSFRGCSALKKDHTAQRGVDDRGKGFPEMHGIGAGVAACKSEICGHAGVCWG